MDYSIETAKYCQETYGLAARLFVGNIPNGPDPEVIVDDLYRCFGRWAVVEGQVSILMVVKGGLRVAWAQYKTRAEAQAALAYAQGWGMDIQSRRLRVEWALGPNYGQGTSSGTWSGTESDTSSGAWSDTSSEWNRWYQ